MKKSCLLLAACAIISVTAFGAPREGDCQLNSTCSYRLHGQADKVVHTYHVEADKNYVCSVTDGNGNLFSVNNVQTTSGMRWSIEGRFDHPLYIYGPTTGEGAITYTLHNDDKAEKIDRLRYECKEVVSN